MEEKDKRTTPFWDAALPLEERLDWLLSAMTMDEKLKSLASFGAELPRLGIPRMGVGGEAAHGVEARNDQNEIGKPEVTTSLVQPIGMSATWDPALLEKAGAVVGTEARVLYHRHPDRGLSRWAPTIDLERDPRWGRNEEGYGEDPVLTGKMASAYIQGMQGDDPHYLRIAATLKHFYANNTEVGRGWKNSTVDPRNRLELYLEPFRRAIEDGGAEAVMTAYNKINGTPGILNPEVREILKKQYGVKHVVSDGGAMELVASLHHTFGTDAETIAAALKAGVDAMSDRPEAVEAAAREAYELHLISEEEIDEALRNMYRTKLRLGVYDAQPANPYDRVTEADLDSEENRRICREVSREAVVLLKNEAGTLPLDAEQYMGQSEGTVEGQAEGQPAGKSEGRSVERLALIGPMADVWYQDWYGGEPPFRTTLKDGVEQILGQEVACADGYDRVVFRCGGKPVVIREDGRLCLGADGCEPDVFVRQDWGSGSFTFRSVRTGKYLNMRMAGWGLPETETGKIAADKDAPFDWFVLSIFHVEECRDGSTRLTGRFYDPVQLDQDETFTSMQKGLPEAAFTVEVVEDGLARAAELARSAQQVILALGCNSMINAKEEVDRETIALPPVQEALLDAVCAANPKTVLVLFSNYPYAITEAQKKVPAILWSATGAQDMGAAMAETLFGKNAPAGRLNMTWYKDDSQLPDIDDYDIIREGRTYRYFEGEVLYPFGYGMTYSQFEYSNLQAHIEDHAYLRVTFDVTNTGAAVSDEVAQIYAVAPVSRVKKPLRQLLDFERLKDVHPGETRTVSRRIPVEELRFYDVISRTLMVEEGEYTIFAGASSADEAVKTSVYVPGRKTGVRDLACRTAADHYDDCENAAIVEGACGFSAVTPMNPERPAVLTYRDVDVRGLLSGADETGEPTGELSGADETGEQSRQLCETDSQDGSQKILHLFVRTEGSAKVEISLDGQPAGSWEGETRLYEKRPFFQHDAKSLAEAEARRKTQKPIYADLEIPLSGINKKGIAGDTARGTAALTITLTGDARLCYFYCKCK